RATPTGPSLMRSAGTAGPRPRFSGRPETPGMWMASALYHLIRSGAIGAGPGAGPRARCRALKGLEVDGTRESCTRKRRPARGPGRGAGDPLLGDARAHGERPVVGEPAHAGRVPHPERDRRVELLPDPRHREEQRGRDFTEVVRHGVDALGEVDRGAGAERGEDGRRELGDVAEGQE